MRTTSPKHCSAQGTHCAAVGRPRHQVVSALLAQGVPAAAQDTNPRLGLHLHAHAALPVGALPVTPQPTPPQYLCRLAAGLAPRPPPPNPHTQYMCSTRILASYVLVYLMRMDDIGGTPGTPSTLGTPDSATRNSRAGLGGRLRVGCIEPESVRVAAPLSLQLWREGKGEGGRGEGGKGEGGGPLGGQSVSCCAHKKSRILTSHPCPHTPLSMPYTHTMQHGR